MKTSFYFFLYYRYSFYDFSLLNNNVPWVYLFVVLLIVITLNESMEKKICSFLLFCFFVTNRQVLSID